MATMADGIAVGCPGDVPFQAVQRYVDEMRTVSEESLSRALLVLIERAKLVVEPAGAAAVAALLDDPDGFATPAVAVLSGGNIDPLLLMQVIRHGMAAAGRYLYLRVRIPDCPGGLAAAARRAGRGVGANVLEVVHERTRRACTSTRSRCSCRWRRAARSTPSGCWPRCAGCGYRVIE